MADGVDSFTGGRPTGISALHRRYDRWLTAALRRRFGSQDSDDLAQDTWLRLASIESLAELRHPKAFLLRVATNLAANRHHRRRLGVRAEGLAAPLDRFEADQADSVLLTQIVLGLPEPLRDALVVAGCYLHSDGFEAMSIWPMDRVEIFPERPFTGYEALKSAWSGLADKLMTEMIISGEGTKTPVKDTVFEIDGVTYVKPAPPLGKPSEFYVHGRPRNEPTKLEAVATTFPGLSPTEFSRLQKTALGQDPAFADYEGWKVLQDRASASGRPEQPFVVMPVTRGSYEAWLRKTGAAVSFKTLLAHANDRFDFAVRRLVSDAREQADEAGLPRRCVMVLTEVIGQDAANDVSQVALVTRTGQGGPLATPLVRNARMSHRQALALAAAHAVAAGVDAIVWWRDERYAWR